MTWNIGDLNPRPRQLQANQDDEPSHTIATSKQYLNNDYLTVYPDDSAGILKTSKFPHRQRSADHRKVISHLPAATRFAVATGRMVSILPSKDDLTQRVDIQALAVAMPKENLLYWLPLVRHGSRD